MGFGLMVAVAAVAATATSAAAAPTPVADPDPAIVAAESSASLVASQPAYLFASAGESFIQGKVISSAGKQYVPYERTYKGLQVVGGDFVLVTKADGRPRRLGRAGQADRHLDRRRRSRAQAAQIAARRRRTADGLRSRAPARGGRPGATRRRLPMRPS